MPLDGLQVSGQGFHPGRGQFRLTRGFAEPFVPDRGDDLGGDGCAGGNQRGEIFHLGVVLVLGRPVGQNAERVVGVAHPAPSPISVWIPSSRSAAAELPHMRLNTVSATVLEESADAYAAVFPGFASVPGAVAAAFVRSVYGSETGQTIRAWS